MASPQASDKLFSNMKVTMYDHDPANSTVATDIGWVDMRDYSRFAVITFASALTGAGTNAFSILANDGAAGGGTDVTIKTHAVASAPDAVGDYLVLECTVEEIAQEAADAGVAGVRYVSANLTCANAADENVIVYIQSGARFPQDGLTADVVA